MKSLVVISLIGFFISLQSALAFEIDFSRREAYLKSHEVKSPESETLPPALQPTSLENVKNNFEPSQDVVILNTEKGFIPESLSLKAGVKYKIHVVNVNANEKNVSFIMSAFAQHHGTYYGEIKTFEVVPQREGVYTYQCPETSLEGKVVVVSPSDRAIANEK